MLFADLMTNVYLNFFGAFATVLPNLLASGATTGDGLKFLGAGVAGIGTLGAGIGQGIAAQGACMAIGRNPEMASKIQSAMIIGAGIAESGAIYSLVIAILLVFVA